MYTKQRMKEEGFHERKKKRERERLERELSAVINEVRPRVVE